jgi:HlyD family secretion protein
MRNKKRAKKIRRIVFGSITVLILILIAAYFLRPKRVSYESVTAKTGDITTYYSFSGNIQAKNRQTVMSEKVMQVSELEVKEGDTVKEGDLLMKTTTGDEITAPIDGELVNLNVEEGAQVMGGIKLMDIVDYNNLEVQVKVDEYDLPAIEVGKETAVSVGAISKDLTGTISSISKEGQVQNGVTYFTATVDLNPDDSLRVGMSAEVKLLSAQAAGVVTLPVSVIQFDKNNNAYILKENANGRSVQTDITVGINDGITAEIKSGAAAGESILDPATAQETRGFGFGMGRRIRNNGGGNND